MWNSIAVLDGGHADVDHGIAETIFPPADLPSAVRPNVEAVDQSLLIRMAFTRHDHQSLAKVAYRPRGLERDRLVEEVDGPVGSDQGVAVGNARQRPEELVVHELLDVTARRQRPVDSRDCVCHVWPPP